MPRQDDPLNTEKKSSLESTPQPKHLRWGRALLWVLLSLVVVLALLVGLVSFMLKSDRVHQYLLTAIQKQASDKLGVQVTLKNFTLHPSTLSVDIYGLLVQGAAPYANPPILQLDHAGAGIRIVSFLQRRWYLDQVTVDRPVIRAFSDANGITNIPTPKSSDSSSSSTNIFDLGVRHALLAGGEFYYNDKKAVLAADLHNLDFRAAFNPNGEQYSGTVSYENGHLQSGTLDTIPHNLQAEFDATRSAFHLRQSKLTSGGSQLTLTATVNNYNNPIVDARYDALVDASEVRRILKNDSVPSGIIHTNGVLRYQNDGTARPAIEAVVLTGDLDSKGLAVRTPSLRAQVDAIAAHYSLQNGNAIVENIGARLLGGQLTGSAKMQHVGGNNSSSEVQAVLRSISLAQLKRLAPVSPATKDLTVGGVLNAELGATWGATINDLVATTKATLHGSVARVGVPTSLPIEGLINGSYTNRDQAVALKKSYLRFPQSTLTMDGAVSNNSALAVNFDSRDLHELDTLATIVTPATPGQPAAPLGLAGTASFKGLVRGSTEKPHLTGQLQVANLQVKGSSWRIVRTDVDASPSLVALRNAVLEPLSHGHIGLNASSGLRDWSYTNTSPIEIDLTASQIDVGEFAKIAGSQVPVTGTLAANIKVHGTELNPVGQGDVTVLQAKIQNETLQSTKLTFVGTGQEVRTNLAIVLAAGTLKADATIRPREQTYQAVVATDGIRLDQLETLKAGNVNAIGSLTFRATGQGSFKDPQATATMQIPRLEVQHQVITGIVLQATVANHVASATLNSQAINTSIQAKAKVNLEGDYYTEATVDTQAIPLQPLAAIFASDQAGELSGQTELHGNLKGPLKDKTRLEAHVTIPMLKVAYGSSIQLAAAAPIHADFINSVLTVQRSKITGTSTDLEFQGTIPTVGNAPVSLLLLGTVNLEIAQLFSPDTRSSGQLRFNINSYGARTDPNVEGQIEVVDASYASGDLPVGLQHGNGTLTLTKDRLNITKFEGTVGGGKLTAQGGVAYRPALQFNMGLAARGIRLLYPQGMRESIDADVALSGTPDNALLGGQVRLNEISFTPDFDLTSFAGQFSGGATPPPAQGFTQNLRLNIGLSSTSGINLVSRTLSIAGNANLQVRGTAAQPVILGRVNLSGGDIIINNERFVLAGGTIQFVNPAETQPVVNVSLDTTIQEYNIHLRFNGPVDQLRTNYASDPALPAADIINLLAFKKTNEAGVDDPATSVNQSAQNLVASQVSSQITSRVSKIAGISQLSIDPVLGGSQTGPGAKITIQQRVTGNLYVTFSSDVTSTQSQVITGQYRVSPRLSLSGTRDQNGGFAVDARIKKAW
jgi:translocation and assembly module TamB